MAGGKSVEREAVKNDDESSSSEVDCGYSEVTGSLVAEVSDMVADGRPLPVNIPSELMKLDGSIEADDSDVLEWSSKLLLRLVVSSGTVNVKIPSSAELDCDDSEVTGLSVPEVTDMAGVVGTKTVDISFELIAPDGSTEVVNSDVCDSLSKVLSGLDFS